MWVSNESLSALGSMDKLCQLFDYQPSINVTGGKKIAQKTEVKEAEEAEKTEKAEKTANGTAGSIVFDNVSFSYKSRKDV